MRKHQLMGKIIFFKASKDSQVSTPTFLCVALLFKARRKGVVFYIVIQRQGLKSLYIIYTFYSVNYIFVYFIYNNRRYNGGVFSVQK
jgi:hypothetical protein